MFAASDISSVIALAKAENGSKQAGADERIRRRQFADIMRVELKTLVFVGVSEKFACLDNRVLVTFSTVGYGEQSSATLLLKFSL